MSFKEQLAKHENILNRFKALYINNETHNKNNNDEKNNDFSNNILNNSEKVDINNDINETNFDKGLNKYNFIYGKEIININNNNNNNKNLNDDIKENEKKFENQKKLEQKKEENVDLGKIDNLLDKLNFKRENNINNSSITEQKNILNKRTEEIETISNKKFDIGSIKSKYINNDINAFNITEKYYSSKDKEEDNNYNTKPYSINNIKKINQLNARNEIERIKSKYYSINLNNIINKQNYLNNGSFPNNKNIYNIQLNKDILEIKNKLELYRNEVKEISLINQKDIKNDSESFKSKEEISIDINSNSINKNDNINLENNKETNNIIENGSNQINIPNLNFQYNLRNKMEKKEEMDDNPRKEIDIEINSYENFINNDKSEINEVQNNNMNGFISEIKRNSNNQILNSNNNDFDYSEVLPIIDKVSKLKDINEIEDNYEKQKTQRINITNSNINTNSNGEEVPNIVNSILDALSNKLITSSIENKDDNERDNNKLEKPKLITKNNNTEDKMKKIISFKEFLAKEENNIGENTNKE